MGDIIDFNKEKLSRMDIAEHAASCLEDPLVSYYQAMKTILDYIRFNASVTGSKQYFISIEDMLSKMPIFFYMSEREKEEYRKFYTNMSADLEGIDSLLNGRAPVSEFDAFVLSNIV